MVRQGDIEISLVHADTKEPFKEHTKDGKVYVEVEPNAEYFISIHRVGNAVPGTLLTVASVDGKSFGYQMSFPSIGEPYHAGLWTCKNGTSTQTALMFQKPRSVQTVAGDQKPQLLMGKVEVEVYNGILSGYIEASTKNHSTSWEESTIDQNLAGSLAEKKSLRSGQGAASCSKQVAGKAAYYTQGSRVDVFTLNYCAAMGLIQVGVLPKPPLWVYARMLHPAKKRAATSTSSSDVHPAKIIRSDNQENELFDLSNVKNENDSDEE